MENRTSFFTAVCFFLLCQTGTAKLTVDRLPHGLLERNETIQTCTAMYHLIIVFGGPSIEHNGNVSALIMDTSELVKQEQFPGMDFALTLLEQLNSRYRTLTSTPNSKQYPDTTGAVARKSSIGRTPVPRPSARQPNPGTGTNVKGPKEDFLIL